MTLNDLLKINGIDPQHVLVFRHRPQEAGLNKVLPWLASEKPEVYNAYQQTQDVKVEKAMARMIGSGYVASCIRHGSCRALFVGLYSIGGSKPLTLQQYWRIPAHKEMKAFGHRGLTKENYRGPVLLFDLVLVEPLAPWKGRLILDWPPPERSWWRRAHRNDMPVVSILEESALDSEMPRWDELDLSWEELRVLPSRWKAALSQWRGIYYIFDTSDGKGYVGSAYGEVNIFGRWRTYAACGHGGNKLLRHRDPRNFRFSILQRVSPDMEAAELIRLESSWKERLHTRHPFGLNEN